jgi:hypothetical protein
MEGGASRPRASRSASRGRRGGGDRVPRVAEPRLRAAGAVVRRVRRRDVAHHAGAEDHPGAAGRRAHAGVRRGGRGDRRAGGAAGGREDARGRREPPGVRHHPPPADRRARARAPAREPSGSARAAPPPRSTPSADDERVREIARMLGGDPRAPSRWSTPASCWSAGWAWGDFASGDEMSTISWIPANAVILRPATPKPRLHRGLQAEGCDTPHSDPSLRSRCPSGFGPSSDRK